MASNGLLPAFLSALQSSLAVLLTVAYGVIAAQWNLLDGQSARSISKVCVRMFLPALLITKVGAELHLHAAVRYLPVLIWAISYVLISIGIGVLGVKIFRLPRWVTPAICFNNTTSLPLLLIHSLATTGILSGLAKEDEAVADLVQRATSYFLVNAIVGNCMTFALGPRLLDLESIPDTHDQRRKQGDEIEEEAAENGHEHEQSEEAGDPNEQTSLLPRTLRDVQMKMYKNSYDQGKKQWDRLHPSAQWGLGFVADFFNAPLIGALIGTVVGLVPPLHRLFFNTQQEGGYFKAWLTASLSGIGDLFASLQIVVVGVTLSASLRRFKQGDNSGHVPVVAAMFVLLVRFVLWPAISIPFIWLLATRTDFLSDDPMLRFAMMLMPTGPPAMHLISMAEVSGADAESRIATSKILAISYVVTPLICFAVVGALKVSQATI